MNSDLDESKETLKMMKGEKRASLVCYLSKGNVKGHILAKIALEGIALCENAGLHVDAVVTDGARWNRNMLEQFNVGDDSPSATHPCDDKRKLWFFSDWYHLVKCMRNLLSPESPRPKKSKKNNDIEEDNGSKNTNTTRKRKKAAPRKEMPLFNTRDPQSCIQKSLQVCLCQIFELTFQSCSS